MKKYLIVICRRKKLPVQLFIVLFVLTVIRLCATSVSAFGLADANPISGKKIVIDPGHGGIDGGTNSPGFLEKDINLDVAKKLYHELTNLGAKVIMTRDRDKALVEKDTPGMTRHRGDLLARVTIIEKNKPDIFLSIHVNANSNRPASSGSMVFFNRQAADSALLAKALQNNLTRMMNKYNFKKHTPQYADYFILRNTNRTGVIIELGFITNYREKELLKQDSYQHDLTKTIVAGIKEYFSDR